MNLVQLSNAGTSVQFHNQPLFPQLSKHQESAPKKNVPSKTIEVFIYSIQNMGEAAQVQYGTVGPTKANSFP